MRILFFGNNWLGWKVLEWLKAEGEEIVGLAIHPLETRKYAAELSAASGLEAGRILDGSRLEEKRAIEAIRDLRPDVGISVLFGYILRPELQCLFPRGVLNLHPSLLPFNRGACPNVWSIVEGSPAGTTLHYIDERIDTGDIIAQNKVEVEPVDTGATLYRKLEHAAFELFRNTWPRITANEVTRRTQPDAVGSCHRARDLEAIDRIELDRSYTARELINILRARTFPPHPGAYFQDGGRRVNMRLELEYGERESA